MKRYTEQAPITKAVRQVEKLMDELNLTLQVTRHGIAFVMGTANAVYLDVEGEDTEQFPHAFESKLVTYESYMNE